MMWPFGNIDVPQHWKRDVVLDLIERGIDIRFVVEDHKRTAESIRQVVPVLLYERIKP